MLAPSPRNGPRAVSRDTSPTHWRRAAGLLGGGGLERLVRRARRLEALQREAAAHLGLPLAAHVRVADVREGTLVLLADGPAWAARARFHARSLAAHLGRRFGLRLTRTRVRVVPPPPEAPRRGRPPLPPAAREALLGAARGVSDPDLRAALRRLARRGSKNGAGGA